MNSKKNILFLINPISGIGKKGDIPDLIKTHIGSEHNTEIQYTEHVGHGKEITASRHHEFDAIIAIGGDGTVNEVASQLINTKCALGVIPAGSGNGLARHLKIPLTAKSALERIASFQPEQYDTGTVNGEFFVGTCGFGFDGYIAYLFDHYHKRGFISYAKLIAREYMNFEPIEFEVSVDGELSTHKALVCAVGNSSQFGNGFTISPDSNMQDGVMELILIDKFPLIDTPAIGTRFFTQTIHNSKYFHRLQFKQEARISVKNYSEGYYHLDGEPRSGMTDFTVNCFARNLLIL
ncbi:MAG: diacylglycerol kinase family protein [Crocinitomicaceae bacterium]